MNPFLALPHPLVLASRSPRREALLRESGLDFRVVHPQVEERPEPGWGPEEHVVQLARRKAEAGARALESGARRAAGSRLLVLGADTEVIHEGDVLGKPATREEAIAMLERLAGNAHEVLTGLALLRVPDGALELDCARTRVRMRRASREELAAYADTGEPMDKAGAYAVQGLAGALVDSIDGCYFNVVGLPLALLGRMVRRMPPPGGTRP